MYVTCYVTCNTVIATKNLTFVNTSVRNLLSNGVLLMYPGLLVFCAREAFHAYQKYLHALSHIHVVDNSHKNS